MNAHLVLIAPEPRPGDIKLKLPCIVGRSKQAGLTIIHSSISRQHCELSEYEGQLVANDLGSLNGTFINDTRINEPTIVPAGGLLKLGSVILEAHYGDDADLAPPQAGRPRSTAAPNAAQPAATEEDGEAEYEMVDFTGSADDEPAADEELVLDLDEEDTTVPMAPPAPAKAAPAKPAAPVMPNAARPGAPRPPSPPAPAKPVDTGEQTVSFVPNEPDPTPPDEVDPDMAAFFKTLQ